jgi:uncharacterized protein YcfJ
MKNAVLFSAMGVLAASGTIAQAQEVGKVLSSTPVIQQVQVPRQVCNNQVVGGAPPTGGGAVVGGVTGGLLGNAISSGSGSGKAAATALGIVGGALLGNSIEASNNAPRNVQRCTTQTFLENRTVAYNVRYEYAGREYDVQMPYDPGPTIRLQVTPIAANQQSGYGNGVQQADGVITAPPVQGNGRGDGGGDANGQAPIQPVYPAPNQAQPAYPVSPQVQNTQTPTYLQSPDGYPPAQIVESTSSYYPNYPYYGFPYSSYYGSYPYSYGYPYYGSYWPYFPVALSLGFGYWGGGGHGYYGHGGGGHNWSGGHGGWGGGHGGGGWSGGRGGGGGGGGRR